MESINTLTTIKEIEMEIERKALELSKLNRISKTDLLAVFFIELNQTKLDSKTTQKLIKKMSSVDCI